MTEDTWTPDVCFYHFPCDDGFASAWVVHRRWPDCELVPINYGQPLPPVEIAGKNILIADFSFKPDLLRLLADTARTIVVLDHHKTAAADLAGFASLGAASYRDAPAMFRLRAHLAAQEIGSPAPPNVFVRFDMENSGAGLTWCFAFPGEVTPRLIQHVRDRDLWRFHMAETRAVTLFLKSHPYEIWKWGLFASALEDERLRPDIIAQGRAIERFFDIQVAEIVKTAYLRGFFEWAAVPVAHAPYAFVSDVGNALLREHPTAPFAAVIVDGHGGRTVSLRSEDSREDVSQIARRVGGGGHRNAAGFRLDVEGWV